MNIERIGRTAAAGLLAAVLMLGAGSTAVAQEEVQPITTEAEAGDGFDWGLLGLLGLIGLAGLRGRGRDDTTTRDTTVRDTKR